MKYIFLSIILFLSFLNSHAQVKCNFLLCDKQNTVKSYMISATPEMHHINSITKYSAKKSGILSYYLVEKVKFTLTAGLNGSMITKINGSDLITGEFNDVEMREVMMVVKYDARIKIYYSKKLRLLMRAQIVGSKNNSYTAGCFYKMGG